MLGLVFASLATFCIVTTVSLKINENSNSCVDSCDSHFSSDFFIDLSTGQFSNGYQSDNLIEILSHNFDSEIINNDSKCNKNTLLRIPVFDLEPDVIIRIELAYGDHIYGPTFHASDLATMDDDSVFVDDRNADILMDDSNLKIMLGTTECDESKEMKQLLNEAKDILNDDHRIVIYLSNKWVRIDDQIRNLSQNYKNERLMNFFESENCNKSSDDTGLSRYLYIGLNRPIGGGINDGLQTGVGLCSANISFLNCYSNDRADMDIDINKMTYVDNNKDSFEWIQKLNYLQPALEDLPCSGEGVLKLMFQPNGTRKIARFDLNFGDILSGFTFNIGDSPTNNGYGGDAGSTSNSAEIHSNDNRFYVWLNPKFCGDTLLHSIHYEAFKPFDNLTIFASDQRIEISNGRDYHETFKNKYLYNVNGQNVTCNCFDTRCYPGVARDNDLYFSMNRVIGGTFRPGVGLCKAKITWLECKSQIHRRNMQITRATRKWTQRSSTNIETTFTTSTTFEVDLTQTELKTDAYMVENSTINMLNSTNEIQEFFTNVSNTTTTLPILQSTLENFQSNETLA